LLTRSDRRLLGWLATFCGPFGTEVGKVSPTIGKLEHRGLIARHDKRIALTGVGWHALIADGYEPMTDDGETLAQIKAKR
jgi:hypothetical protein